LFVGKIIESKGVGRIIEMLASLQKSYTKQIKKVWFIGSGQIDFFEEKATYLLNPIGVSYEFLGDMLKSEITKFYQRCHIIILPSESEGFPKVIMEAAVNGCVPAVSNVSTIDNYINADNGLLFSSINPAAMLRDFEPFIADREGLKMRSLNVHKLSPQFTYDNYIERIKNEIIVHRVLKHV